MDKGREAIPMAAPDVDPAALTGEAGPAAGRVVRRHAAASGAEISGRLARRVSVWRFHHEAVKKCL